MSANLILKNGNIYSMDNERNVYEAVAIKEDKIVKVGNWDEINCMVDNETKILDLKGKTVVPGFIDAHQHIISFGFNLLNVNCNKQSIKEIVQAVEEKASTLRNEEEWIIGFGFDETKLIEGRAPHKDDFAHINHPIFLTRFCLHTAVVNDKALALAGINERTIISSDGEICADHRGLTGVLREKAMDLVKNVIPPYSKEQIKKAIRIASEHYIKEGITGVHEAGIGFYTDSLDEYYALSEMSKEGLLEIRIYGMILEKFWNHMKHLNLLNGTNSEFFTLGSIKLFSDGTLSGQTAAMKEEYVRPAGTRGMFMYPREELESKIVRAHKEGYQVAIHAIGDAAIELVIDIYEKSLSEFPRENHRHRIEHCGVVNSDILDRMANNALIPVPHPGIVFVAGDIYKDVLKPQVLKGLYNIKSFIQKGLQPAFSSDSPVLPSSPLFGIHAAVSRKTSSGQVIIPEQAISIYEAIEMYTRNAAYASFSEEFQGTIEIGKYADMVILPEGFMHFNPDEIQNASVEMTIIGGKVKYERVSAQEEVI